jgi:hypothetical protein
VCIAAGERARQPEVAAHEQVGRRPIAAVGAPAGQLLVAEPGENRRAFVQSEAFAGRLSGATLEVVFDDHLLSAYPRRRYVARGESQAVH